MSKCSHQWADITEHGEMNKTEVCAVCGVRRSSPQDERFVPDFEQPAIVAVSCPVCGSKVTEFRCSNCGWG